MTKNKIFGRVLARIRKERGYSSAHQFFKSAGGAKNLGLSFMSYWDIERGSKLPKSWRIKDILAALGTDLRSSQGRELLLAYFRELSGSDELLQIIASPPAVPRTPGMPSLELAEAAAQKALAQLSVNLTLEQWELLAKDRAAYICQHFLTNTEGWTSLPELAQAAGLSVAGAKLAIRKLAAAGLAELSGEKVLGKFAGRAVQPLPATPATAAVKAGLAKNWSAMLAGAALVATQRRTVRMTKAGLELYRQHLERAVSLCEIYSDSAEDRKNSDIYAVETGIFDVL